MGRLIWVVFLAAIAAACSTSALDNVHRAEVHGGSGAPCLFQVFDAQANLAASWHGLWRSPCMIGWVSDPELLLFYASTSDGRAIVAGDPTSGELFTVVGTAGIGRLRVLEADGVLIIDRFGKPTEVAVGAPIRVAELEGELAQAESLGFRVVDEVGVTYGGNTIIADRGLGFRISTSTSGRWVAIAERQRDYTYGQYRLSPDSRRITLLQDAEYDVLGQGHGFLSQGSATSPDGRWTAEVGREIRLVRRDGYEMLVDPMWLRWRQDPDAGAPVWSPDSSAFAIRAGWESSSGITIVGVDGSVRPVIDGWVDLITDWTAEGLSWVAWGGDGGH